MSRVQDLQNKIDQNDGIIARLKKEISKHEIDGTNHANDAEYVSKICSIISNLEDEIELLENENKELEIEIEITEANNLNILN